MSFFPLSHRATWEALTEIPERSGQKVKKYIFKANINCLVYADEGAGITGTFFEYTQEAVMYTDANIIIPEGDRLINFVDNKGNIINAGPYVVVLVAVVTDFSGNLHHVQYKLNK